MPSIESLLDKMRRNPVDIRFADAERIAEHYFGKPRLHGSHRKYSTP